MTGDFPLSMAGQMFSLKGFNIKISLSTFFMSIGGGMLLREFVVSIPKSLLFSVFSEDWTSRRLKTFCFVGSYLIRDEVLFSLYTVEKHKASQCYSMCVNHLRPSFSGPYTKYRVFVEVRMCTLWTEVHAKWVTSSFTICNCIIWPKNVVIRFCFF